jgi:hypothetical protein
MFKSKIAKLNLGFNVGDKVTVDKNQIYYSYSQFIKRHQKYAARWQYKCWVNPEGIPLTVIGVHRHVIKDKYDKNKYCIVVQDKYKRIYLVGETGIYLYDETCDKKAFECDYCITGKALAIRKTNDFGIAIHYPNTLIAYGYDIHGTDSNGISTKIDYCPKCGRKLNWEDNSK